MRNFRHQCAKIVHKSMRQEWLFSDGWSFSSSKGTMDSVSTLFSLGTQAASKQCKKQPFSGNHRITLTSCFVVLRRNVPRSCRSKSIFYTYQIVKASWASTNPAHKKMKFKKISHVQRKLQRGQSKSVYFYQTKKSWWEADFPHEPTKGKLLAVDKPPWVFGVTKGFWTDPGSPMTSKKFNHICKTSFGEHVECLIRGHRGRQNKDMRRMLENIWLDKRIVLKKKRYQIDSDFVCNIGSERKWSTLT